VLVEDEVSLFVLESIFVLLEELGALELAPALELELGVELVLVLGALEPPAALESLSLCFFEVEPLLDWSFLFLRSPLCLPLFVCVRPLASVDTFGLSVGPALVVSEVVAPAPAFAPTFAPAFVLVEALSFESVLVLAPGAVVPAPMFAFAPVEALPLALVSVLVLWAAASWLKETASRPENSTGKNLRIWFLQGWIVEIQESLLQTPCPRYFGGSTGSSRGNFVGLGAMWRLWGPALAFTDLRFSAGTGAVPPAAPSARLRSSNSFCSSCDCVCVFCSGAFGCCACASTAIGNASKAINSVRMAISLRTTCNARS
jgi:hypothetical protein